MADAGACERFEFLIELDNLSAEDLQIDLRRLAKRLGVTIDELRIDTIPDTER
jgi:hypothetical protein